MSYVLHKPSSQKERSTLAPLTQPERETYARALEQTQAVFALEGMAPSDQDKAMDAAILAGKVSPEQAREELLAYVIEHKSMAGFIESRSWAV